IPPPIPSFRNKQWGCTFKIKHYLPLFVFTTPFTHLIFLSFPPLVGFVDENQSQRVIACFSLFAMENGGRTIRKRGTNGRKMRWTKNPC
uniref:Uncharacterized protein n=1 Tax=Anopheles minimus TaxID=112268 RepID=A0A182WNA9_9DIPT